MHLITFAVGELIKVARESYAVVFAADWAANRGKFSNLRNKLTFKVAQAVSGISISFAA